MYYRQKGQRTPTRPQAIHENFDLCAEALVQRLMSYKTQAEEYHNSCIQGEGKWELKRYGLPQFSGPIYTSFSPRMQFKKETVVKQPSRAVHLIASRE